MLQAIVFDFDGVIVDTEPLHHQAFVQVTRRLGADFSYETYRQRYIGFDDRDGFRAMAEDYGLPIDDGQLVRLVQEKASAFANIVQPGVPAMPGAVELIEAAAARMPIGLCSGALRHDIDLILPRLGRGGLHERFSAIVTADDVAQSKPDPQSYSLTAQRLGIDPQHCLAIEDTPSGIASARGAGMSVLAVGATFPPEQLAQAHRAVGSLEKITVDQLAAWFAA